MAAVLEAIDRIMAHKASLSESLDLLTQCRDIDNRLETWYEDVVKSRPGLYTEDCRSGLMDFIPPSEPAFYSDLIFLNIASAEMMLNYWGIQIRNYETIASINRHMLPLDIADLRAGLDKYHLECTEPLRVRAAFNIIRSLRYCFNSNMGTLGPQCTLFGITLAFQTLQNHAGNMLERCTWFHDNLSSRKHILHAKFLRDYSIENRDGIAIFGNRSLEMVSGA